MVFHESGSANVDGAVVAVFLVDAEETQAVKSTPGAWVKHDGGHAELAGELLLDATDMEEGM